MCSSDLAATPGGTGAVRQAFELARLANRDVRVFVSNPTWPNHVSMLRYLGIEMVPYRYFDEATCGVDFEGMTADLAQAKAGDVVLLHGCCHNPTGANLNTAQWQLVVDLLAKSGATPNAPKCTACPSTMTAPAGVAGGYADSAAPRYAAAVALAVADGSANNNLLTWCNVPAGSWLSGAATATAPGAVTACGTTTSTSPATIITGALSVQTAAAQCSKISSCAADKYLESNGAKAGATPNALICTACPTGMTAPAGTTLSSTHASAAATAIADGAANTNLITWCNVPEGSWLSGAATATAPGAVSSCGDVYQTTTSPATTITGALSVQTAIARCTLLSRCAAGEYLESDGSYQASATGLPAVTNKLVCTPCPTGMTALAGASYGTLTVAPTSAAAAAADTNLATFCNVPNNYWLSTAVTATTPGAVTACGAAFSPSHGTFKIGRASCRERV